jgi:hypothetical protein
VDDRIKLSLKTTDEHELAEAIREFSNAIAAETLANKIDALDYDYQTTVKVEEADLEISLEKS